MTTLKKRLLPASSMALVLAAAAAVGIDAANAAQVPVRYGTDPGAASEAPQYLSYLDRDNERDGVIEHIVEQGETVYALGRRYDVKPGLIIDRNGLRAPYGLQIGQLVLIPTEPQDDIRAIRASTNDARRLDRVENPLNSQRDQRFALDSTYQVRQGDTLYNISRRFGLSVADLAAANNMREPYTISINQRLVIPGAARQQPRQIERIAQPREIEQRPDARALDQRIVAETMSPRSLPEIGASSPFAWPVRGPVLQHFGDQLDGGTSSDGINIAAPIGAPVRATADGEVVYRGSELDGYGNLLLVKHENGWVSAYAHNDALLVRKGDYVRQGQVIAKVGRSGQVDRPQLHFQLRRNLQPTDPLIAMQGELDGAALTAASIR